LGGPPEQGLGGGVYLSSSGLSVTKRERSVKE
jgi:hypothetical protein